MKKFMAFLVVAAALTLAAGSLFAHHGRGGSRKLRFSRVADASAGKGVYPG